MKSLPIAFLMISAFLIPLMITNESIWLDEAVTASFAMQPDFASWRLRLHEEIGPDCQMPLSLLLGWVFGKMWGIAEWQLRAVNVLWALLALVGVWKAGRGLRVAALPLVLAMQPFFWLYTNEARPYSLQIALGAWLLFGTVQFVQVRGAGVAWAVSFGGAAVVLAYTTILAPVTIAVCALSLGVVAVRKRWKIERRAWVIMGVAVVAMLPAAWYYYQTLLGTGKGSQLWEADAKSLAYVIYEMAGLTGLGPPVQSLREMAPSFRGAALFTHLAPQLTLGLVCILALTLVLFLGLKEKAAEEEQTALMAVTFPVLVGIATFFLVSVLTHKVFWARHLAPLFPFYVAFVTVAAYRAMRGRHRRVGAASILVLAALLVTSSLAIRFGSAHCKEDYRIASAVAKAALLEGKTVWWVANPLNGTYYGVPFSTGVPKEGTAYALQGGLPAREPSPALEFPDLMVVSRRTDFDNGDRVRKLIEGGKLQPSGQAQGFTFVSKVPRSAKPD